MLKRVISCVLVAALIFTVLPTTAFAKTSGILYGDVNVDGEINFNDLIMLKQYIAEESPAGFSLVNADVNVDKAADFADLLMIKKFMAEWDIKLGPELITVSFYDGDRLIDTLKAEKDKPLGEVPAVSKSSKENAVLEGYYVDKDFTTPFYAENPVENSFNVYAKYSAMNNTEALNLTTFAQMDKTSDLSFEIKQISGNVAPNEAATLEVKDGSDPVSISVTDEDGDDVYTVSAVDGFNEGCSYELALADGWCFNEKEETIRTASFSIKMEEVQNLEMSDEITYIKDTDSISYKLGEKTYEVLESKDLSEDGGTFNYSSASSVHADDILCIYVGVKPTERNPKKGNEILDPAVYVKVSAVSGNNVSFEPLDAEDQKKLYSVPDNFPIIVPALPSEDTGSVNISALDVAMYATMMGADGTSEKALEKIAIGDFVTLFVSEDSIQSEDSLYYGQITGYNKSTGEITYKKVTHQTILDSMDLYSDLDIAGSDLITDEEKKNIETVLLAQVEESNFATEAASILSDMVTKTDGFRNNMTVKDYLLSDENGNPLSEDQIKLLNIGGSFELSDDIKLTVELVTKGDQLHYKGGVQLAIKVDAGFEVELESGGKIAIDLTASFVEEVKINPSIKGEIITKEILWIPVPIGVGVNATVDIRNFTAFSFAAEIYTVAPEDEGDWNTVKGLFNDPTEVLGLPGIPSGLKDKLKTVGDVMGKIEEIQAQIDKATEAVDTIKGYKEDIESLWNFVEENGITTKEDWKGMGERLEKTSVAADLLGLMNMTTETEISTEYLEDMQALMDKYSEMVQKETDWVDIVNREMFFYEVCVCGVAIGVSADFVVRADMSIAIGSNLEYEVGKRYNFWFKIGLFKPSAGSSTMDLLDEHFSFQFYIMGRIGLKVGVRAKVYVGIGSGKFASVGIAAELGPYIKIHGFFVYEYYKHRSAGMAEWTSKERMAGALYIDFGLYFKMGFEASALGDLFEYTYDFIDVEIPLLTAGESRYFYGNAYESGENEKLIIKDEDGNSDTGITMELPEYTRALSYVDLDTGIQGSQSLDYGNYIFKLSNPNFTIDSKTGVISVVVPEGSRYMECDLTITYRYGKMAFSQYDMSATVPLVWTNLSTSELSEYYTASVRVGNDKDGYQTVWNKRVLKSQEYDLPTKEEILKMIGWSDAKYVESTGYGNQQTAGLTLIENTVYDYKVNFKTYNLTVNNIQNPDGTTRNETFTAKYGEAFDFSNLAETGTSKDGAYTKFNGISKTATFVETGVKEDIDLTQKINGKMAEALDNGLTVDAEYADNSVNVTFSFTGFDHADVTQKIEKGSIPSLDEIQSIVTENGLAIKDINPEQGKVTSPTVYQVICGELDGPKATISLNENGGSDVLDITKAVGSLLGTLPTPKRTGYSFGGWFTDDVTFENEFNAKKMPEGGAQLFAKWTVNEYTVTFNPNGGNALAENKQTAVIAYDAEYAFAVSWNNPTKSGYGFLGWFTAAEGGEKIEFSSKLSVAADHTLYAHWVLLKDIPATTFDFGASETATYQSNTPGNVLYEFSTEYSGLEASDFKLKYMRQGTSQYVLSPIDAGTYDVTVTKAADNTYSKFEHTYSGVITINKATRTEESFKNADLMSTNISSSYSSIEFQIDLDTVDDLNENVMVTYTAASVSGDTVNKADGSESTPIAASEKARIINLMPDKEYAIQLKIENDPNYFDFTMTQYFQTKVKTMSSPTDSWANHTEDIVIHDVLKFAEIHSAAQLAKFASLVNGGNSFAGYTIYLETNIDLSGYVWTPIGDFSHYFCGEFAGSNHTIRGLYSNGDTFSGLFGATNSNNAYSPAKPSQIKDLTLTDSYVTGNKYVGGFVASVYNTDITNCVNEATVVGKSTYADSYGTGGIAGDYSGSSCKLQKCINNGLVTGVNIIGGFVGRQNGGVVTSCINNGPVKGTGNRTGGITGFLIKGETQNSANLGSVTGVNTVGGIVGENQEDGAVSSSYTAGTVTATGKYIGACVGRNKGNDGIVWNVYYLKNSCNNGGRNAVGTETGSLNDGEKSTKAASFTSTTSQLTGNTVCGNTNLISALNTWVEWWNDSNCNYYWVDENGSYPLPTGKLNELDGIKY